MSPEDPSVSVAGKPEDGVDLRTLRAIRVLRPLKLVSGVPSKFVQHATRQHCISLPHLHFLSFRPPGGAQVHPQGLGAAHANRAPRHVCHPHICHHRIGILLGSPAQDLLRHR